MKRSFWKTTRSLYKSAPQDSFVHWKIDYKLLEDYKRAPQAQLKKGKLNDIVEHASEKQGNRSFLLKIRMKPELEA